MINTRQTDIAAVRKIGEEVCCGLPGFTHTLNGCR